MGAVVEQAPAELDRVMVVGLATVAGGLCASAALPAAVATAAVLVVLARRGGRIVAVVAALAFFLGAARASIFVGAHDGRRAAVVERGRWPSRCVVEGVVSRSPTMLGDAMKLDVEVARGDCTPSTMPEGRITIHVPRALAPPLARGDTIVAIAQLAPPYRFWNEETGDPRPVEARRGVLLSGGAEDVVVRARGRGVANAIDRLRGVLRARILATFPADTAAMARALVLGEDDLTSDDQRAFRRSGLAHLLAVSGMHLVLVVATFVAAARAVLLRLPWLAVRVDTLRVASALGLPVVWLYADLAGGSGSAIRAAWMTSAALLAQVLGRRRDTWRAFGLSLVGMALCDPLVAYDLSFALSAAATAGLLGLGARIAAPLLARAPARLAPVVKALSASAAASIACAPVLACMTADLPLAGLVANLVAVPLGELAALPLCLAHGLLEPLPRAELGCALAASGALSLVRRVAHGFAALPWGALAVPTPTPGQLAAIAVGTLGMSRPLGRRPWWWAVPCASFVVLLELLVRARGSPQGKLRVTFLDVGQGDAAIVDLPDGSAMLIDGGGLVGSPVDIGERVVAPVLRARRRSALAAAVLSHPHPDHFGGLRRGLDRVTLGALWDTGQGERESPIGDHATLLAELRARGVPVLMPSVVCGTATRGGARIEVLAPCPGLADDRGPNDNSFVIRISFGARSFLFVGDAEHAEEADLVRANAGSLHADVLKVGHHGSRTSTTPALLEAVAPSVAVISCGLRNRYGHPAPSTLETLESARIRVLRTDRDGAVTITTDGHGLEVVTAAR